MSNWIKANEGMPEKSGQYLVTVEWYDRSREVLILDFWKKHEDKDAINCWYDPDDITNYPCFIDTEWCDGESFPHDLTDKVIAWMPLPEAYERR